MKPEITEEHGFVRVVDGVEDEGLLDLVEGAADELEDLVQRGRTSRQKILGSPDIGGKMEKAALQRIGERLQGDLVEKLPLLRGNGIRERLDRLRSESPSPVDLLETGEDDDPAEARAVEREIRDQLRELSEDERYRIAREALEREDRETLRAILRAPGAFPVLGGELLKTIEEGIEERWADKTRRAAIDALDRTVFVLESNLERAHSKLAKWGVRIPGDDSL